MVVSEWDSKKTNYLPYYIISRMQWDTSVLCCICEHGQLWERKWSCHRQGYAHPGTATAVYNGTIRSCCYERHTNHVRFWIWHILRRKIETHRDNFWGVEWPFNCHFWAWKTHWNNRFGCVEWSLYLTCSWVRAAFHRCREEMSINRIITRDFSKSIHDAMKIPIPKYPLNKVLHPFTWCTG